MKLLCEIDPKSVKPEIETAKCIYWKGEDITMNEAKELVNNKKKQYDNLLFASPFDRMMSIVYE